MWAQVLIIIDAIPVPVFHSTLNCTTVRANGGICSGSRTLIVCITYPVSISVGVQRYRTIPTTVLIPYSVVIRAEIQSTANAVMIMIEIRRAACRYISLNGLAQIDIIIGAVVITIQCVNRFTSV